MPVGCAMVLGCSTCDCGMEVGDSRSVVSRLRGVPNPNSDSKLCSPSMLVPVPKQCSSKQTGSVFSQ